MGTKCNVSRGHGDKSLIMLMGYIDLTERGEGMHQVPHGLIHRQKGWEYYQEL